MKLFLLVASFAAVFAASWPADPIDACVTPDDGLKMLLATLDSYSILNGDLTSSSVEKYDRLHLEFSLHASYRIIKLGAMDLSQYVDAVLLEDATNHQYRVAYTSPTDLNPATGCKGKIVFDLWLGLLKLWGFSSLPDAVNHQWNLTGTFRFLANRTVTLEGEPIQQHFDVLFPVTVTVPTKFDISSTPITVYGTSKVTGSIILFKEHDFPSQRVTVYYLFSVQYPYEFINITENTLVYPRSDSPTGIDVMTGASLGYYNDYAAGYCKTDATNGANWCYMTLKVDYRIHDECSVTANDKRFDGNYMIHLKIGCRPGITWCEVPATQNWQYHDLSFSVTSNNICERFLNYDSTQISGHLDPYPSYLAGTGTNAAWDHSARQYTYIPDNNIYFVVDLQQSSSFAFKMTKVKVINITFGRDEAPAYTPQLIYANGAFLAPYATDLSPALSCSDDTSAFCKLADGSTPLLPTAWWRVNLNHAVSYLNLYGKLPMTIVCYAYLEITYDWAETRTVLFSSTEHVSGFPAGAETFINAEFTSPAASAASITGTVVGIVVGCLAFCGAVSALVVYKIRQKRNGAVKLAEPAASTSQ